MDIEKLIAKLRSVSKHPESVLGQAANALAELQTENVRWKQVASEQKKQLDKLQAAMDKLPTITLPNEWVNIKESLPKKREMCLLYTLCDGFVCVGFYDGSDNRNHRHKWRLVTAMRSTQTLTKKVTHWMFLPEPPDRNPLKRGGDGR